MLKENCYLFYWENPFPLFSCTLVYVRFHAFRPPPPPPARAYACGRRSLPCHIRSSFYLFIIAAPSLATMGYQRRRRGASSLSILALLLVTKPYGTSAFSLNHPNAQRAHYVQLFSSVASAADTGTTGVAGPPAIILDGLTCTHDGGTKYQLDKVSYNLPRGKRIGLVGKNGAS